MCECGLATRERGGLKSIDFFLLFSCVKEKGEEEAAVGEAEVAAAAVEAVDLLPFCDYNISLKSSNDVTDTFSNDREGS